jgi:hypothetical protein
LISNSNWANGSVGLLIHVLIGGVQPIYGWRAPVTLCYIKRWELMAQSTRFAVSLLLTDKP